MKKKILVIIALIILSLNTGCTKYVSDKEKGKVVYEKTGQSIPSNILCRPEDPELLKLYEKYESQMEIKLTKLPKCNQYKMSTTKSSGLWETVFVKPLAYLILKVGDIVSNYGLSVMILGLLIRLIMFPLSKSTIKQSENMKKAQPEIAKIEKKYENKTDKDSMMKKSEETMITYKKYKINPLTSCLMSFIQLPLFLAFLEAINRVPAIFEGKLLGIQLGTTPLVGIKNGNYLFIILILAIIASTYFSLKNAMGAAGNGKQDTQKQTNMMAKFMLVIISIASLSLPAAIGFYWITTNTFTIFQNLLLKGKNKDGN